MEEKKKIELARLSRRDFLKSAGIGGLSVVLAGAPRLLTPTRVSAQTEFEGASVAFQNFALWIPECNDLLNSQCAAWADSVGASVNVEYVGLGDLPAKYATVAESKAGVDFVALRGMFGALYRDLLIDVDDIAEEIGEKYGPWVEFAKTFAVVDGHWKVIPHWVQAHGLIYRTELFAEVGYEEFPATWEELMKAGEKLKEAGTPVGFSLGHALGDGTQFCQSILWSFGGRELEADGKTIALDSDETRNSIEFVKEFYEKAMDPTVLAWDDASNNRAFLAEAISCTNNSVTIYAAALKDNPELAEVSDHGLYPAGPVDRANWLELNTLGVYNFSENQEAAKDLIRYLLSEEQWIDWIQCGMAGNIPPLEGLLEREELPWHVDPKLAGLAAALEYGQLCGHEGTPTKVDAQVWSSFIINDMYAKAVTGEPVDSVVEWAVKQLELIVGG